METFTAVNESQLGDDEECSRVSLHSAISGDARDLFRADRIAKFESCEGVRTSVVHVAVIEQRTICLPPD